MRRLVVALCEPMLAAVTSLSARAVAAVAHGAAVTTAGGRPQGPPKSGNAEVGATPGCSSRSAACAAGFPAGGGCSGIMRGQALVAQPDRVVASEAIGRGFESLRAHQMVPPGTSKKVQNP